MMEAAVGKGSAKPFMKEEEQQGDLNAFCGEPVGVPFGVAFEESMTFQAPEIVAELIEAVLVFGQAKRSQHGLVNLA